MQKNNENNGATRMIDLITEKDVKSTGASNTINLVKNETLELIKSTKGCLKRFESKINEAQNQGDRAPDALLLELGRQHAFAEIKAKQLINNHGKIQSYLSGLIYSDGLMGTLWADIHDYLSTLMYLSIEMDKLIVRLTDDTDLFSRMRIALELRLNNSATSAKNGLNKLKRYQLEKGEEFSKRHSQQTWYISHKVYFGHNDWNYVPGIKVLMRKHQSLPDTFMSLPVQTEIALPIEVIDTMTSRSKISYERQRLLFEEILEKCKDNSNFVNAELLGINMVKTDYQRNDYELFAYIECKSKDILPELVKVQDNTSEETQILRTGFNNQYKYKDLPVYLKIIG